MNSKTVRELMAQHSITPNKALGQNFLINEDISEQIVRDCGIDKNTAVVEVGPGLGSLTHLLADAAGHVTAVELDRTLYCILDAEFDKTPNVTVINDDATRVDYAALAAEHAPLRPVFCSNLPYQITTPLVTALLKQRIFPTVCVMVQKEAAQRFAAAPGNPQYNESSVYAQYSYDANILFDVTPDCFIPQPHVTSAVIRFTAKELPDGFDEKLFSRLVRAAFGARRKKYASNLARELGGTREEWEARLAALGFKPDVRGESLSPADFIRFVMMMK